MPVPTSRRSDALGTTVRRWARYPYQLSPEALGPRRGEDEREPDAAERGAQVPLPSSPFTRLAVLQAFSSSGDALVAVALAGSVFFDVSAKAAQSRVALSLALTVAPFAVVGPLVGALVEHASGGRKAIALASAAGRAVCCFFMALWASSLALFPAAFFALVFSKLYLVTKAAMVPGTVSTPDQLVTANSKLSVGGSAASLGAGTVGAAVLALFGAATLLRTDIAVYATAAWAAARLTVTSAPPASPADASRSHQAGAQGPLALHNCQQRRRVAGPQAVRLPPGGLQLAALATGLLRCSTGFVTLLLVFTFRRHGAALVWYGFALGASQVGNVTGALLAPRVRRLAAEELMLTAACTVVGGGALTAGIVDWGAHWGFAVLLAGGIGLAAGAGKLAFDSMVQRDVPSRARGRAFARFESGFQLAWALGGLTAVLVPIGLTAGFVAIGLMGALAALAFVEGSRRARRGALPSWFPGAAPGPEPARPEPARQGRMPRAPASSAGGHTPSSPENGEAAP